VLLLVLDVLMQRLLLLLRLLLLRLLLWALLLILGLLLTHQMHVDSTRGSTSQPRTTQELLLPLRMLLVMRIQKIKLRFFVAVDFQSRCTAVVKTVAGVLLLILDVVMTWLLPIVKTVAGVLLLILDVVMIWLLLLSLLFIVFVAINFKSRCTAVVGMTVAGVLLLILDVVMIWLLLLVWLLLLRLLLWALLLMLRIRN
jgi:hypothetical protein